MPDPEFGGYDEPLRRMIDPLAGKRSVGEMPSTQEAIKKYGKEALEPFGQLGRILTGNSEDLIGDVVGVGAAALPIGPPGASRVLGKAAGKAAQELLPGTRAFTKQAEKAWGEVEAAGKGSGPLDLGSMAGTPEVMQADLPRYIPPRGVSPRLKEALEDKNVIRGVDRSIQSGIEMGADKWYHNEPIRRAFVDELGPEHGMDAFDKYMHMVAATSPRSDASTNIRNASFYYGKMMRGEPLPAKNPQPYGHMAQQNHAKLAQNIIDAYKTYDTHHPLGASVAKIDPWDLMANPKPASFFENLRGNLLPGTVDTHAFRNIGMRSGDPRFLETQIREVLKPGKPLSERAQSLAEIKDAPGGKQVAVYRPQQLLKQGRITMDELQKIPAFWAAQPNANEYAAAENLYRTLGHGRGMPTADAQAAAWAGGGELTGLETPPTHTFPELFNERVHYTSKMRNEHPKDTLRKMIRGEAPLLSIGGLVALHGMDPDEHVRK